jgi:hypothetical protein
VILVGDCHSKTGSEDFSTMLTEVVARWNNVPENQDLTGATFTPHSISFKKTTCDGDYEKMCNNNAITGRISSCNGNYGNTGWSGLATLALVTRDGKIIKATSKINEYYKMDNANSQEVLCQEIGHGMPMGHQSEDGSDQNSCMDYSTLNPNNPANRYPNKHDVELLDSLYNTCPNSPTFSPTTTAVPTATPTAAPTLTGNLFDLNA